MRPADEVNFGLVQLEPGADPVAVQRELQAIAAAGREGLTPATRSTRQSAATGCGSLRSGSSCIVAVVLAVVVGVIFVYQMMAADIRNMLPEYATVKALGYRPPYLTGVVLWQAVLLARARVRAGVRRGARAVLASRRTTAASRPA